MKKLCAILGIVLILVGGGLVIGGFATNAWKPFEMKYEDKTYTSDTTSISGVVLDLTSCDANIVVGDALKFDYQVSEYTDITVTEENGVLKIVETQIIKHIPWIYSNKTAKCVLTLPVGDDSTDLTLKTVNGSVNLAGNFGDVSFTAVNGEFRFSEASAASLTVSVTNGDINLSGVNVAGETRITAVNAEFTFERVNVAEGNLFFCKTVNGEIDFSKLSASRIEIKTTNGEVNGSVIGAQEDYTINTSTLNGKSNLKNQSGKTANLLSVTTLNGDIEVVFIK